MISRKILQLKRVKFLVRTIYFLKVVSRVHMSLDCKLLTHVTWLSIDIRKFEKTLQSKLQKSKIQGVSIQKLWKKKKTAISHTHFGFTKMGLKILISYDTAFWSKLVDQPHWKSIW